MKEPARTPRFSERLRKNAEPHWRQSVKHRFTQELINDTLPDPVFARYLIQDYAFIEALAQTLEFGIEHARDQASKTILTDFRNSVTGDETDYFLRSFEALGIPEKQWREAKKTPTTRRLGDVMLNAARTGYAETLAVLLPAEWVYLTWAGSAGTTRPSRLYLAEWIDIHANPAFADFVEWLRAETDRLGPALPPEQRGQFAALFREVIQLEAAFFDAAYA